MSPDREALALWRQALQLVEAKGVCSENRDSVATLICRTGTLTVASHRPETKAQWSRGVGRNGDDTGRKVLDVIWTDGTMPVVVSYHGGAWQWILKRARF
jgi:hypothetical protein